MANPENYKSISIDLETYNLLTTVAEAECRTISGQIRWMIKNGMLNASSPSTPHVPTVHTVKRKVQKKGTKLYVSGATADILVKFFQTNATLCASDFKEFETVVADIAKTLYNLMYRGDLVRVGNTLPIRYHITDQGQAKAKLILERR